MSAKRKARGSGPQPAGTPDAVAAFGKQILAAADPLEAESLAAVVLTLPYREDVRPGQGEVFTSALLEVAGDDPSPEAAALLRAITAIAPPHQRRLAVAALGKVTAAGYYPPEWAAQVGRATPKQARRLYDVFGDAETVAVTFAYGEDEHVILVQVDRCREPTVLQAGIARDVAELGSRLDALDDPMQRSEPIELAEARWRIEAALARDDPAEYADMDESARASLPIARARVRRLPVGDASALPRYEAADRSAAVTEFLTSPQAAEAGDEKAARFWAELLAGYSACIPGDPPTRIGPLKLAQTLLSYVPNTFALTDEQRGGMPEAVVAWSQWAAQRQHLDDAALTDLAERRAAVLGSFDEAYDDPENSRMRCYLADLSATTTDAAVLADAVNRRGLAVPIPDHRDDEQLRRLDASDPEHRRMIVEHEFGECDPPEHMSQPDLLAAVVRVSEQLWHDDPPELWQEARQLQDAGATNHDVIHTLAARGSES